MAGDRALIVSTFLMTLTCALISERVPVNHGFGWDGVLYGAWARDFYHEVIVKHVDSYYIQRILPSAVVHYGIRLVGLRPTDAVILRAFDLYAVALLTLAAWAWCRVARSLELSAAGKWLGFIGLFVNYVALKFVYYVPPGTESTAYALGVVMLACYLADRRAALAVVSLLGAFAWPMSLQVGALLLIFPRGDPPRRPFASVPGAIPILAAAAVAAAAGLGIWLALRTPLSVQTVLVEPEYIEPFRPALLLSAIIAVAYLAFGALYLLKGSRLFDWRWLLSRRHLITALVVVLALVGLQSLQTRLSYPAPFTPISILPRQTAYAAVAEPGVFLVTHIAFYGPMFLLAMFLWKRTCACLHESGTGVTLVVCLGLLFSLNSQSRFTLCIFPMVVAFVVKAADSRGWGVKQYAVIVVASVLLSKVWFVINTGPFHGRLHEFPDQRFFMTHGPWISPAMYALQGAVFVVLAAVLYAVCVAAPGKLARASE